MSTDRLPELLAIVRVHLPDVDDPVLARIERDIRARFGAEYHYIARKPKRLRIEALATGADPGVSARRRRELGRLVEGENGGG